MVVNARPAAGGGRWVDISPQRLRGWLDGFYGRHDGATEEGLTLTGTSNGDTATLHPPPGVPAVSTVDALLEEVARPRPIGLLLARKGAVAAGVVSPSDRLISSKVERFYVQGRTAAGGWSQQRYARRRGNQTDAAVSGAADVAARVLLPVGETVSLVCGGDRAMVDAVLEDPRLAPLGPLRHAHFLDVAEPRHNVLEEAAVAARRVRIHLVP
jgi:hypothetical protein